jgi:hypothetical protein
MEKNPVKPGSGLEIKCVYVRSEFAYLDLKHGTGTGKVMNCGN